MKWTAGIIAGTFLLTACGGTNVPTGNVLACQHLNIQANKYESNATPSGADIIEFGSWISEDAALAEGQLKRDLTALADAIQHEIATLSQEPLPNPSAIRRDCAVVGVDLKFEPQ